MRYTAKRSTQEATVAVVDGASGADLFKINFASAKWGGDWQIKRGQLRDMADQLARDLAFFLVETLVDGYSYPEDVEVCFDGVPYPVQD